ncbi:hypothetical protein Rhe02_14750 [Rhizocola hellebori]|uniref:Uncharacterized protein n=1 Tax=Rhizocola hellebori TaxID=1392758 RepID=A0A8J3Q3S7_9ACTN|nr:hypothetical protein Rhe02_14750 [Rhizocola hellebori]
MNIQVLHLGMPLGLNWSSNYWGQTGWRQACMPIDVDGLWVAKNSDGGGLEAMQGNDRLACA